MGGNVKDDGALAMFSVTGEKTAAGLSLSNFALDGGARASDGRPGGAGILLAAGTKLILRDCVLRNFRAVDDGGAIRCLGCALVYAEGTRFVGNWARGQGRKRVRNSQLQRLISRSFSTRFG